MDRPVLTTIVGRELRAGVRSRWFLLYLLVFLLLSIAFSVVAAAGTELTGQPGFGRTAAGLLNLMLLMVPLLGLTIGAQALVADRQDGSLDYLLAQPVSPAEVFVGKYLGAALALLLILVFGFGLSAVAMAARGTTGSLSGFLVLVALTLLLGLAMLSVGYLISSGSPQTAAALGLALTLWLGFVIVGDLGLMGSALVMDLSPGALLAASLANPLDAYKLVAVQTLQASLDVLGPAGIYATRRFGSTLPALLLGLLALWVVVPLPIGYWLFKRTDYQ